MYHSNSGMHCNPFGAKMSSSPSVPDSTESKESKSILAPAHFRPFDNSSPSISSTSKFTLRPSSLSTQTTNFSRTDPSQETSNEASAASSDATSQENSNEVSTASSSEATPGCSNSNNAVVDKNPTETKSCAITESNNSGSVSSSTDESSFTSAASKSNLETQSSGFVFGQNIHERVTNVDEEASSSVASNGTTELSFAHTASARPNKFDSESSNEAIASELLCESAKKYESRLVKRTYDEVTVITGEEDESNVLQVNCKLYLFDKPTSTWHERGRGMLRLNDKDVTDSQGCIQSRLVMRTQGSLRVVLNSKLWPGMCAEKASLKSVRITAMDSEGVNIYLIQTNPKDADQLFHALDWRIMTLKRQTQYNEDSQDEPAKINDVDSTTQSVDESPVKRKRTDDCCEADTSSVNESENTSSQ